MLKFSLYHNFCSSSSVKGMHLNTYDYRIDQSYTTDRQATSATGRWLSARQKPRLPYELPLNITESQGSDIQGSCVADRNDTHIRQFMGEALRDGGHQKPGDTP